MADSRLLPLAFSMMKGTECLFSALCRSGDVRGRLFATDSVEIAGRLGLRDVSAVDSYIREEAVAAAREEIAFCDRHSIRVLSPPMRHIRSGFLNFPMLLLLFSCLAIAT